MPKRGRVITWRAIRIVLREVHLGLEVAAIVGGLRVDWNQSDVPFKDVLIDEL